MLNRLSTICILLKDNVPQCSNETYKNFKAHRLTVRKFGMIVFFFQLNKSHKCNKNVYPFHSEINLKTFFPQKMQSKSFYNFFFKDEMLHKSQLRKVD